MSANGDRLRAMLAECKNVEFSTRTKARAMRGEARRLVEHAEIYADIAAALEKQLEGEDGNE